MTPYASIEDQHASCKRYYEQHKGEIKRRKEANHLANPSRRAESERRYYLANREARIALSKRCKSRQPIEERRAYMRRYYAENREHLNAMTRPKAREYSRRRRATLKGNLDNRMRSRVWKSLRTGWQGTRWQSILGYTLDDLQRHLEAKFKPGMTWALLMEGKIHIDHVIPISKFNYTSVTDLEFRRCWALENLSPEWKSVNLRKHAKLIGTPQIALGI